MKEQEMSFTNQWGKTVTFINPNVIDWQMTRERITKTAVVTITLTYDDVKKTNPLQISAAKTGD